MIVVSDTSPLINLARVGALHLLFQLYTNLVIPTAVWREVTVAGSGRPGDNELRTATWIHHQAVTDQLLVRALGQELDPGESEAIVLALELKADLLLMDERLGRETAKHLGLSVLGILGVLVEAKQNHLIPEVKPLLEALRDQAGFWISHGLYTRILEDVGE